MNKDQHETPPVFCTECGESEDNARVLFFCGAGTIPPLCNSCFEKDAWVRIALCRLFGVPKAAHLDYVSLIDGHLSHRQFVSMNWTYGKAEVEATIDLDDFVGILFAGNLK